MSTATDEARQAFRERAELAAMDKIAERLATQFPEVPAEHITRAIQGHYAEFEGSRIRDFVPVLVERSAKADLTAGPARLDRVRP